MYSPNKFDIIKWEYVLFAVPTLFFPVLGLLEARPPQAIRRVALAGAIFLVIGGFFQSWISASEYTEQAIETGRKIFAEQGDGQ